MDFQNPISRRDFLHFPFGDQDLEEKASRVRKFQNKIAFLQEISDRDPGIRKQHPVKRGFELQSFYLRLEKSDLGLGGFHLFRLN